jgi:hypothetical protein
MAIHRTELCGLAPIVTDSTSINGDETMKTPVRKRGEMPESTAPQTLHSVRRRKMKTTMPGSQSQKRDNIFSKSRDTREDRGTRQAKTTNNAQTQTHRR